MSRRLFRVAFLGAGIVAEMHGRAIELHGAIELAGVYDPDRIKAHNIVTRFGGRTTYTSESELFSDGTVDAVYVLTPVEHHVRQASLALSSGKHVMVEKPVAVTRQELTELERWAERHQKICMPGHNYIYVPALQRGKRLISEGKLGEVASLWVLYNIFHPEEIARRYGGVLREVCVHHVYSLLYLLGRPVSVVATTSRVHYQELACEDQVMLTCQMPGGALAHLWASFAASDQTNHPWSVAYKVLGSRGGFSYDWNEAIFDDNGGPAWGLPCYLDGFIGETAHFFDQCISRSQQPLSALAHAGDTLSVIEAAERSLVTKGIENIVY